MQASCRVILSADRGSGIAFCHPCSRVLGTSHAFQQSARVLLRPAIEQRLLTNELLFVAIGLRASHLAGCALRQTKRVCTCGDGKIAKGVTGDKQVALPLVRMLS
jgi:hypothetical protein